ncbi:MBL fold metallo-hydrolase, partial [Candidatus Omnitrophota bacterium]
MILETIVVGSYEVNCYILAEDKGAPAIIIDPGSEADKIKKALARHKLTPGLIINTHGHADHIAADDAFGIYVYIHQDDIAFLDDPTLNLSQLLGMPLSIAAPRKALVDKQEITLGRIRLQVLHTPGHTPGGICLWL